MDFTLEKVVWELTARCNMNCFHCGSACGEKSLPGELNTKEALVLADDIAVLKPNYVGFSGGEPLLRNDWHLIAQRLSGYGIDVHIITNGSLLNESHVKHILDAGIKSVSVSVDGTYKVHERIRRRDGCYNAVKRAFTMLKEAGIPYAAITTAIKENMEDLPKLRDELIQMDVSVWRIQPALLVGNMTQHPSSLISPQDIQWIIDFSFDENKKGVIDICLPDNVGYYTRKEVLSRQLYNKSAELPVWQGCSAGIRIAGILHNGDVVGCTSIRNADFIEGNVRERKFSDIWTCKDAFAWRRQMRADLFTGKCRECRYIDLCLGGCTNTRLTSVGNIYADNKYCVYGLHSNAVTAN